MYIHIPFCSTRCAYCDFNTYAGLEDRIPAYVSTLGEEIRGTAARKTVPVSTVFFGGGTPSLLSVAQVATLLAEVRRGFDLAPEAEITLEVNPGDLNGEWLTGIRDLGVNRLSMGAQSANPAELRFLTRRHTWAQVVEGVELAAGAGYSNLSLDLIYGIPGQTLTSWRDSLEKVLTLPISHLSLYGLTVEDGTPLGRWVSRGLSSAVDEDFAADCYEMADQLLPASGFQQYEISNWAQPGFECSHNLVYWRYGNWFGFGAGAHGLVEGVRTVNVAGIDAYLSALQGGTQQEDYPASAAAEQVQRLPLTEQVEEFLFTGLRLTREGISLQAFRERFGEDAVARFTGQIRTLRRQGLLEDEEASLRLTPRARLLANRVFREFLGQ